LGRRSWGGVDGRELGGCGEARRGCCEKGDFLAGWGT
jgi:hypothetical protein